MLEMYLIALGLGGTLLAASLFLGGDTDFGDVDVDADVEADTGDTTSGIDVVLAWLPVTSMRFWTFFLAFFGLAGSLLIAIGEGGQEYLSLGIAIGLGYGAGAVAEAVFRALAKNTADSSMRLSDYIGSQAAVVVPVAKGKPGKVRIQTSSHNVEFLAETEDDTVFGANQTVMVYATNGQILMVTEMGENAA